MNARQEVIVPDETKAVAAPEQQRPASVLTLAIERNMSADVIGQLITHQERIDAIRARRAFDDAMAAAKAEIPVIKKNRHVGFASKKAGASSTDYWHEDLGEIAKTIGPILAKHGLSYRFRTDARPNEPVTVTCIIAHRDGHFEENTLSAGRDDTGNKNSIQQIGSTVTYLQRYTLKAALGLAAAKDDDARSAEEPAPGRVSEEQVAALRQAIMDGDLNIDEFYTYAEIERLEDMEASKFDWAMREIAAAAQARAAKKTVGKK